MSRPLNVNYTNGVIATTSAPLELLALKTGIRYRVNGMQICPAAANNVTIQTSTGGVYFTYNSTGAKPLVIPPTAIGVFETAAGRGIYMQLNNPASVRTHLQYQVVQST